MLRFFQIKSLWWFPWKRVSEADSFFNFMTLAYHCIFYSHKNVTHRRLWVWACVSNSKDPQIDVDYTSIWHVRSMFNQRRFKCLCYLVVVFESQEAPIFYSIVLNPDEIIVFHVIAKCPSSIFVSQRRWRLNPLCHVYYKTPNIVCTKTILIQVRVHLFTCVPRRKITSSVNMTKTIINAHSMKNHSVSVLHNGIRYTTRISDSRKYCQLDDRIKCVIISACFKSIIW